MLEARSLTKYYNHTLAVRNVSFAIRPGEILGYLGSNGAGKSTTVKMLTGLLEPSDGQILFNGQSIHGDLPMYQSRLGYVPEEAHLYQHLSGWEYLQLVGRLRGMPRRTLEPKMDEFLRLFSLWGDRHDPLSSYSKGMRQKILLSAALLHNPDVLILDEPFSGLDVNAALMLRNLLHRLAGQGKMILFSSHVLEVVEKVCTNVLILRRGEVVAYDAIERLQDLMSQPSLEGVFAQLTDATDGDALAAKIVDAMARGETQAAPESSAPAAPGMRVYRKLAGAFPQEFQNAYGEDLLETTEDAMHSIRRHGAGAGARLLVNIAGRVIVEHFAELQQDMRYGLRTILKSPGFTAVALLSLSLGICIATCAFSEMNGMVLRTLPAVQNPSELVALQSPVSYPAYRRFEEQRVVFSSATAYAAPVPFSLSAAGHAERMWGHLVAPSYFTTLGVRPALGSFFSPAREAGAQARSVVISDRLWRNRFGADPAVIGKIVRVNGQPCTVIGVGPEEFLGASPLLFPADLWLSVEAGETLAPELADNALERRDLEMFFVVGRLQPGVLAVPAEAQLDGVARQLEADRVDVDPTRKDRRVLLVEGGKLLPLRKQDLPFFTSFLTIMALLIMGVACASVGNMMLARAVRRRKEIAVRLSLGASRARLIRQLLTESMILTMTAGVIGYLLSNWLMALLSHVRMPFPMPVAYDFRPDGSVLALTAALCIGTGIVFGLAPAVPATKADVAPALKEGGEMLAVVHRRFSLRNLLIVSQVACSITLLVAIGLLSFGIQTTLAVQTGFDARNLYAVAVDPTRDGYSSERTAAFLDRLLTRVKALPSVTAASLTETVPVSMPSAAVTVSDSRTGDGLPVHALRHVVGRDYFETTGIAVRQGRPFRREDEKENSATVIVSEALARTLWGGNGTMGQTLSIRNSSIGPPKVLPGSFDFRPTVTGNDEKTFQVIGVAADVAEGLLIGKPRPAIYFPLGPESYRRPSLQGITLLVRAAPGARPLEEVRREIEAIDDHVLPFNARSMSEHIDQFMAPLRSAAWTYAVIGLFGLVLASVGLAGVTAYAVAQRNREIGIRIALGATNRDVLSSVMKEGLLLTAVGSAIGMAGAWAVSRFLAAMNASVGTVSSTSVSDPVVLIGAPLLLACCAAIACYMPARGSVRVDPAVVLRQE